MKAKFDNRRRFHRITLDKEIGFYLDGDGYDCCRVKNISLGGVFVTGNFSKKPREECQIKLDSEEINLKARAKVAWVSQEGVGLQFKSMTRNNYMFLLGTLIKNARQPAIILHEFPKECPFDIEAE